MDQIRPQDQQQKDFLAFLFPDPSTEQNRPQDAHQTDVMGNGALVTHRLADTLNNFPGSNNTTTFNQQPLDLMAMSNLLSFQGLDLSLSSHTSAALTPQMLLEQQYKLTQLHQLQQLQNQIQSQIFQQQLALISGQTSLATHDTNPDPPREQLQTFNGLPTPLSSTEIRPSNPEILTRMNPPFPNSQQSMYGSHGLDTIPLPSPQEPSGSGHFMRHAGSVSAPANIAFPPFGGLPSPSDLDISPLTSPWLEAYPNPPNSRPVKRTASPNGEDTTRVTRKRQIAAPTSSTKAPRNVKSATSTPLMRSSVRGRRNSTVLETDSPSPVDLSMPPPAPPGNTASPPSSVSNPSSTPTPQDEARIMPVTPASIMNLGRLGVSSSLAPVTQLPKSDKGKETVKSKEIISATKGLRKVGPPLIPGPKPILPAGMAPSMNSGSSAVSPTAPISRKSHKDAEQKRRDSLKAAYDDLRTLLPPIPLPSDENFPDEPLLPGALPPRGPPKAGGDGPNKGVSKLQLLRCGNDYLRTLKGRVDRRDIEIATLRQEVLRLRTFAGEEAYRGGGEFVDLEYDLDAVEAGNPRLGQSAMDDDGDDGDE